MRNRLLLFVSWLTISLAATSVADAQTQTYTQANNEFDFNHTLSEKWALEFNAGQSWTTIPGHNNLLSSLSQLYGRVWVHYQPNDKWKLSFFYAYYFNKYVPEIDQRSAPEWRSAVQATYYITRNRAIISTRWRIEDRHIFNPDSVYEAVNRLRGQIKIVYPFNGRTIAPHVFYGIGSDELIFKTHSKISGDDIFDRNKFTAGFGYCVNFGLQIELTYGNEYLPRTPVSNSYNAISCNLIFNDVLPKLNKFLFGGKKVDAGPSD